MISAATSRPITASTGKGWVSRVRGVLRAVDGDQLTVAIEHQGSADSGSGQVEEVSIVRPAVKPSRPFNIPSKAMIVATGIVMGLILGIVLAFGAEIFDTSMGTIEDVEESLRDPL